MISLCDTLCTQNRHEITESELDDSNTSLCSFWRVCATISSHLCCTVVLITVYNSGVLIFCSFCQSDKTASMMLNEKNAINSSEGLAVSLNVH